jgi:hypothetical protein
MTRLSPSAQLKAITRFVGGYHDEACATEKEAASNRHALLRQMAIGQVMASSAVLEEMSRLARPRRRKVGKR